MVRFVATPHAYFANEQEKAAGSSEEHVEVYKLSPPLPFLIKTELKIEEEKGLHKYLTAAPSYQ